jgi:DNA-3-methyladenine glycosylase II
MAHRLDSEADLAAGLAALLAADPRLVAVRAAAGTVALRRREGGFAGLTRIITGQQLSVASAEAIHARFAAAFGPAPEAVAAASDEALRAVGMSRAKMRTLRAAAAAVLGGFDLAGLADLPADAAHAALTAIPGVGPWTADIYLLFCLGHADAFPAGDLALQVAAADALALPERPKPPAFTAIAEAWRPWRGVAATLLWAYYRARRRRAALPL